MSFDDKKYNKTCKRFNQINKYVYKTKDSLENRLKLLDELVPPTYMDQTNTSRWFHC